MRLYVVMGVAGCGKSSVGQAMADRLGMRFLDGDDLHPAANIAKMSAGIPLTDADRAPWLDAVADWLRSAQGQAVVTCSALKRGYRDRIRARAAEPVGFVHLAGSRDVISGRMATREGHFMPLTLLDSQFATLEPLGSDEPGATVEIAATFEEVVDAAVRFASG